jgi:hypothetical protein
MGNLIDKTPNLDKYENPNEDITDTLDNFNTPNMNEAPQSIHVDAYYKGFHAGFTIRKESNKSVAVTETTNLIDRLVEGGWKPSWNEQTNGSVKAPVAVDPNAPVCEIHNKPMTLKPAGVSKTTNKPYPAFWACSERDATGGFCRFKPSQNKV